MDTVLCLRSLFRPPVLAILALCVVSVGCSKGIPTGTVKGTVTLDGQPYADSALSFIDLATGQAGSVDIAEGGNFALLAPLPVGNYTVYLAPKAASNPETAEATPVKMGGDLPQKYYSEAESDIKIEVKEGENVVTVELKSGG